MKNQKKWYLLFSLLFFSIPSFWFFCIVFLPVQFEESFLGELKYKVERIQNTEGKRIILIGGSGTAFGVKSDLLKEEFPEYEIVNMGQYAALGTKVMLELSEDAIHAGDIVLLMPEQNEQTLSMYMDGNILWQALDGRLSLIGKLDREDIWNLLGSVPGFAAQKWKIYLSGGLELGNDIYQRRAFNEYEDIEWPGREQNQMIQGFDPNQEILFSSKIVEDNFLDYVNAFHRKMMKKGAKVYYYFAPANEEAVRETEETLEMYYLWLGEQLQFPILGNPENSVMNSGWFYDTNYHLNSSGAIIYTYQLIRDLKLLWRDVSRTEIVIPEIPERQSVDLEEAGTPDKSSDAYCFIGSEVEQGYVLTGLTEEGKARKNLTIPVMYEGKTVIGIIAGLFQNNTVIEKITIQENIKTIPDEAFKGCVSLKELCLLTESPGNCLPGSGLLSGTNNCRIKVPEGYRELFRLHYFWHEYAGMIE